MGAITPPLRIQCEGQPWSLLQRRPMAAFQSLTLVRLTLRARRRYDGRRRPWPARARREISDINGAPAREAGRWYSMPAHQPRQARKEFGHAIET